MYYCGLDLHAKSSAFCVVTSRGRKRRRGMTQTAITAALLEENTARCDPPLREVEVRSIAKSVARYRAGSHVQGEAVDADGADVRLTHGGPGLPRLNAARQDPRLLDDALAAPAADKHACIYVRGRMLVRVERDRKLPRLAPAGAK